MHNTEGIKFFTMLISLITLMFLIQSYLIPSLEDYKSLKDYQIVQNDNIVSLANHEEMDLSIRFKNHVLDYMAFAEEDIMLIDTKKGGIIYSFKNINYDCKYRFFNNSWYIKKTDIEKCSKDKAISEINRLVLKINDCLKTKENNKVSWETN